MSRNVALRVGPFYILYVDQEPMEFKVSLRRLWEAPVNSYLMSTYRRRGPTCSDSDIGLQEAPRDDRLISKVEYHENSVKGALGFRFPGTRRPYFLSGKPFISSHTWTLSNEITDSEPLVPT